MTMGYKSCSRCGRIHTAHYYCRMGRKPINWAEYHTEEDKLHNTYGWHKKAEQIKAESGWLCALCEAEGIYNCNELEVHHIEKVREKTEKLLGDNNLICLCRQHHRLADAGMIDKEVLCKLNKKRRANT